MEVGLQRRGGGSGPRAMELGCVTWIVLCEGNWGILSSQGWRTWALGLQA